LASWWIDLTENAAAALQSPPTSSTSTVGPPEIGEAVYRQLLASDEAERIEGDNRRYLHDLNERNEHWPDLVPVRPSPTLGMELDHAEVYGSEVRPRAGIPCSLRST
jgi:hypothetical protein